MKKATRKRDDLDINDIYIKDTQLNSNKLPDDDATVNDLIDKTIEKQTEILELNKMDQEELRMVVKL